MSDRDEPLSIVDRYYSDKIRLHGANSSGVDWNSEASQRLRFDQLMKIAPEGGRYSLNDVGCGYGALLDHLAARGDSPDYLGVDVSAAMIEAARARFPGAAHARFETADRPDRVADLSVASGIFNVRPGIDDAAWREHVYATLDMMRETSRLGFAFNCLTLYSDEDRRRADLHYADPCALFDRCKRRYAKNVALLHDYGLYEFTVLVRLD